MNINTIDKVLLLLKGKLSASDEATLREQVASDEDYAEDVAFSINLVKAAEAYERNKLLEQVRRLDALRTLRIRVLSILVGVVILVVALVSFSKYNLFQDSNKDPGIILLNGTQKAWGKLGTYNESFYIMISEESSLIDYLMLKDFGIENYSQRIGSPIYGRTGVALLMGEGTMFTHDSFTRLGKSNSSGPPFTFTNERINDFKYNNADLGLVFDSHPSDTLEESVERTIKKVSPPRNKNGPVLRKEVPLGQEPAHKRATSSENKTYGYLYTWSSAKAACPTMLTIEEWDALIEQHGGIHDRMAADDKSTFQGLLDAGYPIALGGQIRKKDGPISGFKKEGWYWSKTEANQNTAWAYYFYKEFDEYKIVKKKVRKTSYLSCLCPE